MKFTDEQLEILDRVNIYLDFEFYEERKGRCESNPVIHLKEDMCYWCDEAEDMLSLPDELIGDWISDSTVDEECTRWNDVKDNKDWHRAVYKEVTEMKWVREDIK